MPQLSPIRAHQSKLTAVDEWMFGKPFASVGLSFPVRAVESAAHLSQCNQLRGFR